ncbi:MAG: hypothetical protein ACHQ16_08235, partial [Candidatus Lutacidiplasmatales archaeon]
MTLPLLSLTLATLLVGTLLTFVARERARYIALATSVVFLLEVAALLGSYTVWPGPVNGSPGYANVETHSWIHLSWLSINYT